jgi:hypothetical protein
MDNSVVMAWCFDDEASSYTDAIQFKSGKRYSSTNNGRKQIDIKVYIIYIIRH